MCVEYIEGNEDWLIANRLERFFLEDQRQKFLEKDARVARIKKKKNEMQ